MSNRTLQCRAAQAKHCVGYWGQLAVPPWEAPSLHQADEPSLSSAPPTHIRSCNVLTPPHKQYVCCCCCCVPTLTYIMLSTLTARSSLNWGASCSRTALRNAPMVSPLRTVTCRRPGQRGGGMHNGATHRTRHTNIHKHIRTDIRNKDTCTTQHYLHTAITPWHRPAVLCLSFCRLQTPLRLSP